MRLPSPEADAALAYMAADEEVLIALRSGDPVRSRDALALLTEATDLRRRLSDARYEIGIADGRGATDAEMLELRKEAHGLWLRVETRKADRDGG